MKSSGHPLAKRSQLSAKNPLTKGKCTLVVDFQYDGGGMGKGGLLTMYANGTAVAEGRLEETIPIQFSLGEGLDIGMDVGSAVDFTYTLPFAFTGRIEQVTIDLEAPVTGAKQKAAAASEKVPVGKRR